MNGESVAEATSAIGAAKLIGGWVAAYREGRGPCRKAESLEIGRRLAMSLDKIEAHWDDAEQGLAASERRRQSEEALKAKLRALKEETQSAERPSSAPPVAPATVVPMAPRKLSPKGWVGDLAAAEPSARIAVGLWIVDAKLAAEGQVAEEMERICGAGREFRQALAAAPSFILSEIQPERAQEFKTQPKIAAPAIEVLPGAKPPGQALVRLVSDLKTKRSPVGLGPKEAESEGLDGEVLAFQHSKNPSGLPPSFENAIVAVRVMGLDCRYNVFHDRISIKDAEDTEVGAETFENFENVVLQMRERVLTKFGFDPGKEFLYDALKLECMKNTFDPILDYLNSLEWDGVPRVDDWLVRYCGAADTPFNRAVGRKVLMAGVRRITEPGCKFDFIMVLESEVQGVGKSTALKILAGGDDNFSDAEILGVDKREQQEAVQGVWIYEVAELDGLSKSEVTRVKVFLSKTVDSARPAYGRARVDRKRRCIFVATTNESTYLRDTTGNRRFWIVPVGEIDLAALARDRDQLWAEAVVAEATGEPLVLAKELWGDAAAIAASRTEVDPWEDILAGALATWEQIGLVIDDSFVRGSDSLGKPEWRVSSAYLLSDVLGFAEDRQNNNHTKRLVTIMRGLGWERPDAPIRIGSKVCRGFKKAAKPAKAKVAKGSAGPVVAK